LLLAEDACYLRGGRKRPISVEEIKLGEDLFSDEDRYETDVKSHLEIYWGNPKRYRRVFDKELV
jgi:hypothetical protein